MLLTAGFAFATATNAGITKFDLAPRLLELHGKANPRRFVNVEGEKSDVGGFEDGGLEGWVYPLKVFHNFQLNFMLKGYPKLYDGQETSRDARVDPQMVQPEYSSEKFTVTEMLFAPRQEPGVVILLHVKGPDVVTVFVRIKPVLNLMWPGAIGRQTRCWGQANRWRPTAVETCGLSAWRIGKVNRR
jgi:hypothetical protein